MTSQSQDLSRSVDPTQDPKLMLRGWGNKPGKLAGEVNKLSVDELEVFCEHLEELKKISLRNMLTS